MPLAPYALSYWEKESFLKNMDVVVIGAGIVGLNAALHLVERQPKLKVTVLERGTLPIGASTRNAGFACFGSMTELLADQQAQGTTAMWELVEKRLAGLRALRSRLGDSALRYGAWGGYELFRREDEASFQACKNSIPAFNAQLAKMTGHPEVFKVVDEKIGAFGLAQTQHLIVNQLEGQLHTGEMMRQLWQQAQQAGIQVLTSMEVQQISSHVGGVELQLTNGWVIQAGKALVATNGFARQLLPELQVRPARNQVLITEPIPDLAIQGCFHYDCGYYYFRNIDQRILLGGGRQLDPLGEETDQFGYSEPIRQSLLHLLHTVILPDREVAVDGWWSGILGVGEYKQPIICTLDEHIVVAVRLGGMGVAIGSLVGMEAADQLLEN